MNLPIPSSPTTYVFGAWVVGFGLVGWGVLAPQRQGRFMAAIAKDSRNRRAAKKTQASVARAVALEAPRLERRAIVMVGTVARPATHAAAMPAPPAAIPIAAELVTAPVRAPFMPVVPPAALPPIAPPPAVDELPVASPAPVAPDPVPPAVVAEPTATVSAAQAVANDDEDETIVAGATVDDEAMRPRRSLWSRLAFWKRAPRIEAEPKTARDAEVTPALSDEALLELAAAPAQAKAQSVARTPVPITWTDLVFSDGVVVEDGERRAMLETLGAIAEAWCGPIVARALVEEHVDELRDVALVAARDGRLDATREVVLVLLVSEREQERLLSVEVLAAIGERDAVITALSDKAIPVATVAAYELGKMMPTNERDSLVHQHAAANAEAILDLLGALS